jgi:hypothetical protein
MSWFAEPRGDLTGAKGGAETVPSLTGPDGVMTHVEWELGVSDRQPVTQENPYAFAQ